MLNKEEFFGRYSVEDYFKISGLNWDDLVEIYDDYISYEDELESRCTELEEMLIKKLKSEDLGNSESYMHSIKGRVKAPEHLIEKIIRKRGKEHSYKYKDINVTNYRTIIRDLIGIRVLVLAKEEWENIFDKIVKLFPYSSNSDIRMVEEPKAYT